MADWTKRRESFRALLEGEACVCPASLHDPISARIAEDLGYELGMFAGSVASLTVLGAPDLILLTLSELAEQAHRISRAAALPVLVDADHGYGNALNVMRTVEELEAAGMAGLSIEDSELPQLYGRGGQIALVPLEEATAKIAAAVEARSDPLLVIAGRTNVADCDGIQEAIARAKAYEAAGSDATFLVGLKRREELEAIAAETARPLIVGGAAAALADPDYLAGKRVRVFLQGHQPFAAAVQALYQTMKALRDGCSPGDLEGVAPPELLRRLSHARDYEDLKGRFLGG